MMKVERGFMGGLFLVFNDEGAATEYADWLEQCTGVRLSMACFGGYMNALDLGSADVAHEYVSHA